MAELSDAAQAVEDAYFNADGFGHRNGLAAALRAAVRNVWTAEDILAVADELDPHEPHLGAPLSRL